MLMASHNTMRTAIKSKIDDTQRTKPTADAESAVSPNTRADEKKDTDRNAI